MITPHKEFYFDNQIILTNFTKTMKTETQEQKIAEYLLQGNKITKLEALRMFGIWNSGDTIFKLRKKGFSIKTEMLEMTEPLSFLQKLLGKKAKVKRYAQYSLIPENN